MDPNEILKGTGRSGMSGKARQRVRAVLVIAETALALVLLAGAGLFLRSLARVEEIRPGFEPRGLLTAGLTLPRTRYPDDPRRIAFYRALEERLQSIPGVSAAALCLPLPFSGSEASASFNIQEKPTAPGDPGPHGDIRRVSSDYFRAMGIPLRSGRFFTPRDREGTERVAVIDENLARQYWSGENPVGRHIRGGSTADFATIVGVVGHIRHSDLATDTGKGVYYYPVWQTPSPFTQLVVRTTRDPASLAGPVREAVRAVDPTQPVANLKTMQDLVTNSLAPRRFIVQILGFFATVALFMAALGLYGVINYSVAQRTQEIGIRVALGASRQSVLSLVVGQGLRLALIGAAIGLAAAIASSQWLKGQLFEVSGFDPLTLIATASVLIGAAAAASYIPARRAMKVQPTEALRYE